MPRKYHRTAPRSQKEEPRYLPTPEELEREMAKIRETWTPAMRRLREVVKTEKYEVPVVKDTQ